MIGACAVATFAVGLAACAGHGVVPSAQSPLAPTQSGDSSVIGDLSPMSDLHHHAVTTCATSPPQYDWIFDGACDKFTLKPTGGTFSLDKYKDITITGSIGKNTVKGSAILYLVDAVDTSDIGKWSGKDFPPYDAAGKTIAYAVAINQSTQTIKPISVKDKPVLQYVITDSKGIKGNECGAAVLAKEHNGQLKWTSLPATGTPKGKSVTITQYEVPAGFELPPKTPLYFAVNCYKK
jgi:hypothetical protein